MSKNDNSKKNVRTDVSRKGTCVSWRTTKTKTDKKTGEQYRTSSEHSVNLLGIIVLILLAYALICVLIKQDDTPYMFSSFLEFLQTVPQFSLDWVQSFTSEAISLPDWLSWLSGIIEFFRMLIALVGFCVTALLNVVTFILWVLKWLLL